MNSLQRFRVSILCVVALGAAGCSGSLDATDTAPTTAAATTTTDAPADVEPETTTTTEGATDPTPPESMPGDIIEFGPGAGSQLSVVGVTHDDTLNVRVAPGTEFEVVTTLAPNAEGVIAAGENRLLESSFWVEVELGDGFGWVNERFVGMMGFSQPLDPEGISGEGGPVAIGERIAERYVSTDPPSRVVLAVNQPDEVVYDVLGIGDDAAKGFRITLTVEGDVVTSVTEQTICSRGVTDDLKCV